MALSLGVKAGSKIRIGDHMLEVVQVDREDCIDITLDGKLFVITDLQRTQIAPEVYVSCGSQNGKGLPEHGRLAIEAPRSIPIIRLNARKQD
jgi:hypothetical protein